MRLSTGVPGFDELVQGGLPPNRLFVVSGPPGSGKTTFCAQFVTRGAREGETCLYVTMHETEAEFVDDMSGYEFGFDRAIRSAAVRFVNLMSEKGKRTIEQFGNEGGLTNRLQAIIEETGADRVVVDSTMLLEHFIDDPERETTAFLAALKQVDAAVVLISEMTDPSSYAEEHYLSHGVVFFHNYMDGGSMTRGVQIIKMRGTAIDADIRHVEFTDRGLRVFPDRKVE